MVKEQQRYAQRLVVNEYLEHGDEDVIDPTQWGLFENGTTSRTRAYSKLHLFV